jgi:hypothetical protein
MRPAKWDPGPFRFEARWLEEESCDEVVHEAWRNSEVNGEKTIAQRLNSVAEGLRSWSKESIGDLERSIFSLKKKLEICRRSPISQSQINREQILKYKLQKLETKRDLHWKQRAHVNWLQKGDKNTKFFHSFASHRKKNNSIKKLIKENGEVVEKDEELKEVVTQYYNKLFTSTAGKKLEETIQQVSHRVTSAMNDMLLQEFTREEIREALYMMGDLKAPGPDGMPPIFYKRYWDLIGSQVEEEVLQVLNGENIPLGWNDTWVALIPKVKNPQSMKDLRPISLCNVVYKLVSKVLANRLKIILEDIIAPNQSAFVPGRLITDNVLLAHEVNHFMHNKRKGQVGYAAVKLDMSKAYDRVEWVFLEKIMRKMGFHDKWIQLVLKCCSTVKYKFKINGALTEEIIPGRGLRQGDPISPYLFLICAEAFSSMLNVAEKDGKLEGIKICQQAPSFNHLLFADDSLILLKVTEENAIHLQNILNLYEESSGQTINIDKSSIVFTKNTKDSDKKKMMHTLKITSEGRSSKYLGMPAFIGKSKKKAFSYIKDRIWGKLQGWKEKLLSKAGKDILIKACAQAIPVYVMTCFDITKSLCEEINSAISRFWWAQQEKDNKIHWLAWDRLTRTKREGGLGYKDLYAFNLAMLAKQGWRLLTKPESLCARVLKARYYPNFSVLQAECQNGISYAWRSVLKGIELLKRGIIKRVGDGKTINIWQDPWLPRLWSRKPITRKKNNIITKVSELINPVTGSWDSQLVREIFLSQDASLILSIPLVDDMQDHWAWHFEENGQFSVKSAYRLKRKLEDIDRNGQTECQDPAEGFNWLQIWKLECSLKVKMLIWRIAHDSLPHRVNLERRGIELDPICPVCNRLNEDGAHLFLKCKKIKGSWTDLQIDNVRDKLLRCYDAQDFVNQILRLEREDKLKTISLIWWI